MLINNSVSWLYIFVLAIVTCQKAEIDPVCDAFDDSTCVFINKCQYVINLITEREFDKARERFCGFDHSQPKVCCPKDSKPPKETAITFNNETEPSATKRPTTIDTAKSVQTTPLPPPPTTLEYVDPFPDRSICGPVKNDNRISGGQVADIDEYPWMVLLKIVYPNTKKEYFACAGSLITDHHVLTAAHCVTGNKVVKLVRLGEHNVNTKQDCVENECNDEPVDVAVKQVIAHHKYKESDVTNYDIAVLVLENSVNFTDFIQPVCLPTIEYVAVQDYLRDSKYMTAGWGSTEFDDQSSVKRKIMLSAVPIETCRVAFENIHVNLTSPNKIICAGGRKSEDSCQGDSGGPLVREVSEEHIVNWYIFGITSFGARRCGEEGIPGAYTRVTAYMDWIREKVSST